MPRGRGALYTRVSTIEQVEGVSLRHQEEKGRDALDKIYDCDCLRVYSEACSGESFYERSVLQEMLSDIAAGKYDVVLFWDAFRLARNPDFQVMVRLKAAEAGCRINFTSEPMTDDTWAAAIQYLKGTMGKEELRKFRERAEMGKKGKALYEGKVIGMGKPPYGYAFTYGTRRNKPQVIGLALHEQDARTVRWIFEQVASRGRSLQSICDELVGRGEPAPKGGKHWWPTTIRNVIINEVYKGDLFQWKYKEVKKNGKKELILRDRSEWIKMPEGSVEPIVTADLWKDANAALAENKRLAARNGHHPEAFLLRGRIECGKCGSHVYTVYKTQHGPLYRCGAGSHPKGKQHCVAPSPIRQAPPLDEAVWKQIFKALSHPETVRQKLLERRETKDPVGPHIEDLNERIKERTREKDNLAGNMARFSPDEPAAEVLRVRLSETISAIENLEGIRSELISKQRAWEAEKAEAEAFLQQLEEMRGNLSNPDYETKRLAFRALDIRVRLFNEDHDPPFEILGIVRSPIAYRGSSG